MKKHISIHPITKEKFIDAFNIDDFRYYRFSVFLRDLLIGLLVLLAYAKLTPLRSYMESISFEELVILCSGFFILTITIMYLYIIPAVHKRYFDALTVTVPRHIMPIMIVYIIGTVLPSLFPSLGIFTLDDQLIFGTLHMLRIELIAGIIIFPISFIVAIINKNKL